MDTYEGPLVLIVEDDPSIARIIGRMLRAAGYQTRMAPDATAAKQALAAAQPALITLDLSLPGTSGAAFLQQLRAMPQISQPAVVVVTAQQHIRPDVRALADDVVGKPFAMEELIRVVGNALAQSDSQSECLLERQVCAA